MTNPAPTKRSRGFLPSPVRDVFEISMQPGMISFAGGNPDLSLQSRDWLAEAAARLVREHGDEVLQYGSGMGATGAREAIVELMAAEEIPADFDGVQVTAGSQMALDVVIKTLCAEGDTVLVEDPTFVGALGAFGGAGLRIEYIQMDADGIIPAALTETLSRLRAEGRIPKLAYLIPNYQNPRGVTLSQARRVEVIEICRAAGVPIVEDNPYGMLGFDATPALSLHEIDPGNVIYLGSFSKVLSPGLRVGWAVAPESLRRTLQLASEATTICASPLSQALAAEFVLARDYRAAIRHAAAEYERRAGALRTALEPLLPEGTEFSEPHGGFFSWLTLPAGWSTDRLLDAAIREQVVFVPGAAFCAPGEGLRSLRLAYSLESPERIGEGAERLGRAFAQAAVGVS